MSKTMMKKLFILSLISLTLSGCSSWSLKPKKLKPWVKPHQRGMLADPIMAANNDPASTKYMNHVYEARESSRGAEGGGGGGCGCN